MISRQTGRRLKVAAAASAVAALLSGCTGGGYGWCMIWSASAGNSGRRRRARR